MLVLNVRTDVGIMCDTASQSSYIFHCVLLVNCLVRKSLELRLYWERGASVLSSSKINPPPDTGDGL